MKYITTICFVILICATLLLCACDSSEINGPGGAIGDDGSLHATASIASYRVIYPDGNKSAQTAAELIATEIKKDLGTEVPVVSDAQYTGEDDYIISVGAVDIGRTWGEVDRSAVDRGSNKKYGAFCISYEGNHIYLYGDVSLSLTAAAEYFCTNNIKSNSLIVGGEDVARINYYSKALYKIENISKAIVTYEKLMSMTTLTSIAPVEGSEYMRVENASDGLTVVLESGQSCPMIVCETDSPFATYKIGNFNSLTNQQKITVIAGDYTKKEYVINYMFIDLTYGVCLSDDALKNAMGVSLTRFQNGKGNWDQEMEGANALLTLALHEFTNNGTKVNGDAVADRILQHLRNTICGGHEPQMLVGPWWANPSFACALALSKKIPAVWSNLSETEKEKLDWIMRGYAVTNNFASNAKNNFSTGPELVGNFSKNWNPNFRSSNLVQILACVSYFGSASEVNNILTSFDYDTYIQKYTSFGFINIVENWTKGDIKNGEGFIKNLMENGTGGTSFTYLDADGNTKDGGYGVGVKVPFTYSSDNGEIPLEQVGDIFNCLINNLYSLKVDSTIGEAYIVGHINSPYEGQMGMMAEYNSGDAKGTRSDAGYCTHNFGIMVPAMAAFISLELWDPEDPDNMALFSRIYVGNEDHIFKMTEGYYSYSHGTLATTPTLEPSGVSVYSMTKSLWVEYLSKFIKK